MLLTPPGTAAIAVARLLGPGTTRFLEAHFSVAAKPGRCAHGLLSASERVIDDPVIVLLPDGSGADVNLHGGPWVVQAFLELAREEGFERIEPGLASAPLPDAATDGRSSLEGEVFAYLPSARTELGLRALLAQVQVWEGFAASFGHDSAKVQISSILSDRSLCRLLDPPRVAIVGAPNVGKSTLANQLFARERSITANVPGTTRDWVGEIANIDGLPVMLVDTPGQRQTDDPIERTAIERSRAVIAEADLVIVVLDGSRPLEPESLLREHPNALVVLNKSDCGVRIELSIPQSIPTAATLAQGVDDLRRAILRHFGCDNFDPRRPRWWTARQRGIIERAFSDPSQIEEIWRSPS